MTVALGQSAVKVYRKRFGKNLIFTDGEDLPVKDVVRAYQDRNEVERVFGEMNDPETVPLQPVRLWTDQKIVIHAFICILGLLLLKLLQLKLKRQGITLSLSSSSNQYIFSSLSVDLPSSSRLSPTDQSSKHRCSISWLWEKSHLRSGLNTIRRNYP